ncbi:MAG: tetratricopeptide repeat protein [Cyclobacteriaceae bacterium]|nr:tetratricopeptide repeat protein [Cyclobacteriaceae bacterium]
MKKWWPVLVSAGSASIMILAFFIPSLQDQWDRYQSRKVIQQYVRLGDEFLEEERYEMAEEAYLKAFELSEEKRLDIEMKRLHAKISRVGAEPEWDSEIPEDLMEVDFQFLLHLQTEKDHRAERVSTLNSYGIFLVAHKKIKEAESAFQQALKLDSADVLAYVNYANLLDQQGHTAQAKKFYLKAIAIEPENARAHYNLGLLYKELNEIELAASEFEKTLALDSLDEDAKREWRSTKNISR